MIVTSRSESRSRDNQKVDLINKDELKNGSLPVNLQCKNAAKCVSYSRLMGEMPAEGHNVVLHKLTKKSEQGRFMPQGEYAIIEMNFFIQLIEHWQSTSPTSTEE